MSGAYHLSSLLGSPPRVRGKAAGKNGSKPGQRITPACAGKRQHRPCGYPGLWDHPRVCGEKDDTRIPQLTAQGSPPRVRGKEHAAAAAYKDTMQITPACAGKRAVSPCPAAPARDHPRVCGEKAAQLSDQARPWGSPPRVRGKVARKAPTCQANGITPACAGKRSVQRSGSAAARDHPRVCGEKYASPGCTRERSRITPACAGKRRTAAFLSAGDGDHPRVCGEKVRSATR